MAAAEVLGMLANDVAKYTHDPSGYARYAYAWGEGQLEGHKGPRVWQDKINNTIAAHLQNPATRFQPLWIAVSSGHGIGKSAEIGMLTNWAMSTCDRCKVVLTAGTGVQLSTKTVPEVSKWFRMSITSAWWEVLAQSIKFKSAKLKDAWRADFVTWSEHNTEPFAGLHNLRKRILLVFDEASAVADKVWEVAEGAMTDEDTEIIFIAFGNPTQSSGRFRECFGRFKHRWKQFQIDSRTVEGTNKEQIERWIEDYGEDSDFVRVRVRGEFPRVGSNQLISSDMVAECRKHKAIGFEGLPKVLGIDVARFGDDQTVMVLRQGRKSQLLGKYRGKDVAQVTAQAISFIEEHSPDGVVVDSDGIGAPVYDNLKFRGYGRKLYEFHGGHPANNSFAYFNQRAEVWGLMRDAIKATMELPDDPELEMDLTGPQYGFSAQNQLQLEKKDDMKKRGLSSPDIGDALAMTYAVTIAPQAEQPKPQPYFGEQGWMA